MSEFRERRPIVRAVGLEKTYLPGGEAPFPALRGVSFEARTGEVLLLLGESGSGKTTLLHLLAGLDRPTAGRVEIEGRDLAAMGEKGRTDWRRRRVGFVFQFFNLLPTLTAGENVGLALELIGPIDRSKVEAGLAAVGLADKSGRYPHELSGGEQQRVAIARALVKNPALILADEPTGNLDTRTGQRVLDLLIGRCRESGTTLLMASHALGTARHADRILRLEDGRLRETAEAAEAMP
jgi:putative ABC transport system ATP-binding protein